MTQNQIAYQTLLETRRANQAKEQETNRHNTNLDYTNKITANAQKLNAEANAFKSGYSIVKGITDTLTSAGVTLTPFLSSAGATLANIPKEVGKKLAEVGGAIGAEFTNLANWASNATFDPLFFILIDKDHDGIPDFWEGSLPFNPNGGNNKM